MEEKDIENWVVRSGGKDDSNFRLLVSFYTNHRNSYNKSGNIPSSFQTNVL